MYLLVTNISLYGSYFGINYSNIIGFCLLFSFIIQFYSGLLLSSYYEDYYLNSFDSVIYITFEVNNGWLIRLLHILGATLFILFVYFHWIRGIWLRSLYWYDSEVILIWISGWLILYLFILLTGFSLVINWRVIKTNSIFYVYFLCSWI